MGRLKYEPGSGEIRWILFEGTRYSLLLSPNHVSLIRCNTNRANPWAGGQEKGGNWDDDSRLSSRCLRHAANVLTDLNWEDLIIRGRKKRKFPVGSSKGASLKAPPGVNPARKARPNFEYCPPSFFIQKYLGMWLTLACHRNKKGETRGRKRECKFQGSETIEQNQETSSRDSPTNASFPALHSSPLDVRRI